ncbi:MAG TPA: multiheme c-type cytochrome [Isosphaeraceae bacterium]|nr:multiheme c-type cytochrome [Isosphaeraceae bacterium]
MKATGDETRARRAARDLAVVGVAAVGLIGGLLWWSTRSTPPRSGQAAPADPTLSLYVGAASCRECHPGEAATFARHGHNRTFRPAARRTELARWMDGQTIADPEKPGVTWSYSSRDGELAADRAESGKKEHERFVIELAFGSGYHATSFLTLTDRDPHRPRALEHRMTYYAHPKRLDLTPGHTVAESPGPEVTPVGRVVGVTDTLKCFRCHCTLTSRRDRDRLDLDDLMPNVSCERCHGPGRRHIEAARRDAPDEELVMPLGPGRTTADEQLRRCGACHRHPATEPADTIRPDNIEIIRFQPVGLMQSKCYNRAGGRLSCTTCHDPHARPESEASFYEGKCLECHAGGSSASPRCPVAPKSGCIDCHMRRRETGQHVLYTDHWIRIPDRDDARAHAASARADGSGRDSPDSNGRISSR